MTTRLNEDNAGGLWLYGESVDGEQIAYGDMAESTAGGGLDELVTAYDEGVAAWAHDQGEGGACNLHPDVTCSQCRPLRSEWGETVASYDGATVTLHIERMGAAARRYFGVPRRS